MNNTRLRMKMLSPKGGQQGDQAGMAQHRRMTIRKVSRPTK
jgi:hypothetical protein